MGYLTKRRRVLLFWVIVACSLFLPSIARAQPAQEALETFLDTIKSVEFPVKDARRHKNLVETAHLHLDLESMVSQALASHWKEAGTENQKAFLDLMWKLVENVAYARSHDFLGDLKITYPEIKAGNPGFIIHSLVAQTEPALDIEIIYHLHEREGRWQIHDVILDGVSLIEDLNYQFDKIINDSAFAGLLERMRNRLAKAEEANRGGSP